MTRSGWSSTQPSTPLCVLMWSQVSPPTVCFSLTVSCALGVRVARRFALGSGALRTFKPTELTTQTELLGPPLGTSVTSARAPEAGWLLGAGLMLQAQAATSPRATIVNRIIGVTLPLGGSSTLGRHPSRRARHAHAFASPKGPAPARRSPHDRPGPGRRPGRRGGRHSSGDLSQPGGGRGAPPGPLQSRPAERASGDRPCDGPGSGRLAGEGGRARPER